MRVACLGGGPAGLYFAISMKLRDPAHEIELFERNHLPVLKAQVETGLLLNIHRFVPRFHGDGRADWDVLVTIIYRDWAALEDHSEAEIAKRLFPDQKKYRKEERHRFELLEAHWDVPLEERPE